MTSRLTQYQEQEEILREKLTTRGSPRAAIIRKETQKKLKQLKRECQSSQALNSNHKDNDSGSDETEFVHLVNWGGRTSSHVVLMECSLEPDPDLFLGSIHAEAWKREEDWRYHLDKLRDPENPLSSRVPAWEDLLAQPSEYEESTSQRECWRIVEKRGHRLEEAPEVFGDEAMFRDLTSMAEQMDPHKHIETVYKLSDGKPSPFEPDHASAIVYYLSETPGRVSGAVVYDCLGQARVDVNFQHHHKYKGRFEILSGHWHILGIGSHSHESGLENHFPYHVCPWIWQAIPKCFNVLPLVPVGL